MALSFPSSPTSGQQYTGPNGVVYEWDNTVGVWNKVNAVQTVLSGSSAATSAARIPSGTTGQRPTATLATGQFRYNTTIPQLEYSDGTSWLAAGGAVTGVTATAPLASSGGVAPDISLTGTVPILNGGTGATTVTGAQTNLLPAQAGNAGKVLSTDGAGVISWISVGGAGTLTSVDVSGGTTGLTYSGGPITTSGTITMAGTLGVANGGTGATTVAGAQASLLPAQAGNSGKFLQTDGAGVLSWASGGGGGSDIPAGSVMLFYQAAAPVGWTQVTTQNDKSLRVVSGAGGGSGGSSPFSSVFSSTFSTSGTVTFSAGQVAATSLSIAQLASHDHGPGTFSGGAIVDTGLSGNVSLYPTDGTIGNGGVTISGTTSTTGSGQSHTHSLVGQGGASTIGLDLAVNYVDVIICSKN